MVKSLLMIRFILDVIAMGSLGLLIYLLARAMPRVDDTEMESKHEAKMPPWLMAYVEKLDDFISYISEKNLRRLKVWLLKFNNWLDEKLKNFKKNSVRNISFETEGSAEEKKEDLPF